MREEPGTATPMTLFLTDKADGIARGGCDMTLCEHRGRQMVRQWGEVEQEFLSILGSAVVFDLGYRCQLRVSGGDQVRWLNGMITNTVKDLELGHSNYSFVLNAQGRILGDVTAYRCTDHILLTTDALQGEALSAHFNHFIIMDDVEIGKVAGVTALGVAGPQAVEVMGVAGLQTPEGELRFVECDFEGYRVLVSQDYSPVTPRFSIWLPDEVAPRLWEKLRVAGASQAGIAAMEMLRVAEGVAQYGVDFGEKYLPQEVDAVRPLHFQKGCYLGQEIVERIRSRATVHRQMRVLELDGGPAELPAAIMVEGQAVGEVTSMAEIALPGGAKTLALGMVRNEPLARSLPLTYAAGTVRALDGETVTGLWEVLRSYAGQQAAAN